MLPPDVNAGAPSLDDNAGRITWEIDGNGTVSINVHLRHPNSDPWGVTGFPGGKPELVPDPLLDTVIDTLRDDALDSLLSGIIGRNVTVTEPGVLIKDNITPAPSPPPPSPPPPSPPPPSPPPLPPGSWTEQVVEYRLDIHDCAYACTDGPTDGQLPVCSDPGAVCASDFDPGTAVEYIESLLPPSFNTDAPSLDDSAGRVVWGTDADGTLVVSVHLRHPNSDPWGATGYPGGDPELMPGGRPQLVPGSSMPPFDEADTDGNGSLSIDELQAALGDAGAGVTEGDTMTSFDSDGDLELVRRDIPCLPALALLAST